MAIFSSPILISQRGYKMRLGFTLLELLFAIVFIGMLAIAVIPKLEEAKQKEVQFTESYNKIDTVQTSNDATTEWN